MKNRFLKRHRARALRSTRRDLVHAAGCVEENCASKAWHRDPEIVAEVRSVAREQQRTVSVPRSLRRLLGRWL